MVTEIVFKNGSKLVFEHDQDGEIYPSLSKETYTPKYDGVYYGLTIDSDSILYKKVFASEEDYICCMPV